MLRFIVDALRFYFEFHAKYDGFYGAFIHDPFAVAAALDRSLVQLAARRSSTSRPGPGLAHGMTVADWRGLTGKPPNLDVAVEGDADRRSSSGSSIASAGSRRAAPRPATPPA